MQRYKYKKDLRKTTERTDEWRENGYTRLQVRLMRDFNIDDFKTENELRVAMFSKGYRTSISTFDRENEVFKVGKPKNLLPTREQAKAGHLLLRGWDESQTLKRMKSIKKYKR